MPRCACLILLLFLSTCVYAQDLITYKDGDDVIVIGNRALYLKDSSRRLTINDVEKSDIQSKLIKFDAVVPNFGNTSCAIWSIFKIENKTNQILYLEFGKTIGDKVDFFFRDSAGNLQNIKTGTFYDRHTRDVDDNFFYF